MSEMELLWWGTGGLLSVVAAAWLYSFGGRAGTSKAWRRWVGSAVVPLFCSIASGNWWCMLAYPAYAAAWSIGYGPSSTLFGWIGNNFGVRAVTGTVYALAALPIALAMGLPLMFFAHLLVVTLMVMYFGAVNPSPAAQEELVIAVFSLLLVPFFVFAL